MKAKCTKCGKTWNVSIYQKLKDYICPHCVYDARKEKDERK